MPALKVDGKFVANPLVETQRFTDVYGRVVDGDFKTGEAVWSEREKLGKGAIAYADERLYCLSQDEGIVALVEASTEGWKEHGRFQLPYDSALRQPKWLVWTHPVISGGRLYLRNQELLFSYDVKADRDRPADGPSRRR